MVRQHPISLLPGPLGTLETGSPAGRIEEAVTEHSRTLLSSGHFSRILSVLRDGQVDRPTSPAPLATSMRGLPLICKCSCTPEKVRYGGSDASNGLNEKKPCLRGGLVGPTWPYCLLPPPSAVGETLSESGKGGNINRPRTSAGREWKPTPSAIVPSVSPTFQHTPIRITLRNRESRLGRHEGGERGRDSHIPSQTSPRSPPPAFCSTWLGGPLVRRPPSALNSGWTPHIRRHHRPPAIGPHPHWLQAGM